MPKRPAIPQSRRERPSKPALTRQGIIEVAVSIMRTDGLSKVTMRRVAQALDTGASSLYVYFQNTEDLHAHILDALLAEVIALPPPTGVWQVQVKHLLTQYVQILFTYPEIARMALTTHPSGTHYLALVERILTLLRVGGVPDDAAAWGVDLLLLYATANAAEHGTRAGSQHAAAEDSALATAITTADAAIYPHIAQLGAKLLSGGPARFQWGLDVFLAGVLQMSRADKEQE